MASYGAAIFACLTVLNGCCCKAVTTEGRQCTVAVTAAISAVVITLITFFVSVEDTIATRVAGRSAEAAAIGVTSECSSRKLLCRAALTVDIVTFADLSRLRINEAVYDTGWDTVDVGHIADPDNSYPLFNHAARVCMGTSHRAVTKSMDANVKNSGLLIFLIALTLLATASSVFAEDDVESTAAADYVVHEWGLVEYQESFAAEVATSGRNKKFVRRRKVSRPKKPLIYFYPGQSFDFSTPIDVTVEMKGATIREVWPTPAAAAQPRPRPATFTWEGIRLQQKSCGRELAPPLNSQACRSLSDDVCEAYEMGLYLGEVEHCLLMNDGIESPVLIYNGEATSGQGIGAVPVVRVFTGGAQAPTEDDLEAMKSPGKPQAIAIKKLKRKKRRKKTKREGRKVASLFNHNAEAVGPLYVFQQEVLYRIERIAAGKSVALSDAMALRGSPESMIGAIRGDLLAQGLTSKEVDDYVSAWSPDQLQHPFPWQVFGFFDPAQIDALMPLRLSPKPREVVRVMTFTIMEEKPDIIIY